jgi:hypothetical protein
LKRISRNHRRTAQAVLLQALLSSAVSPTFVWAADCADVRMDRDQGSLQLIPTAQPALSKYFAPYVASAMLDAHRFTHGDPKKEHLTSPVATLLQHDSLNSDPDQKVTSAEEMIRAFPEKGSCSLNAVNNRFGLYDIFDLKSKVRQIYDPARASGGAEVEQAATKIHCLFTQDAKVSIALDLKGVMNTLARENFDDFFKALMGETCQPNTLAVKPLQLESVTGQGLASADERQNKFASVLHDRIKDKKSEPVGIQFCGAILTEVVPPRAKRISSSGVPHPNFCAKQEAMVVGSRSKNGKCEFLVRSSLGNTCAHKSPWECDGGQRWLDEETLTTNMLSAFFIQ